MLNFSEHGDIWFSPPQFYEITRLKNINKLKELIQFVNHRTNLEYTRWMPVRVMTKNGEITLLPGMVTIISVNGSCS